MKLLIKNIFVFAIMFSALTSSAQPGFVLASPNKQVSFRLFTSEGGLRYEVRFRNNTVIEASRLGITVNKISFGEKASIGKISPYSKNETFPYRGVHNRGVNLCNGAMVSVMSDGSPFTIEIRTFNNGVAFRYLIANKEPSVIDQEATSFVIPSSSIVWSQNNVKYYEGRYGKRLVDTIKTGELMGPPVTIELPAGASFAAITEGGLTDFAGMSLQVSDNRIFSVNLSGVTRKAGFVETPWRIIEVGKDLNALVNCDIIAAVSPPMDKELFPNGYNEDWLKPGRSVWSWLANPRAITLQNMKHFSDLAAELGFEYNLVDEGWGSWKDSSSGRDSWDLMKELVDYSAKKGVKVWVWKAYPDRGGIQGIDTKEKRKAFFRKCKDIGVAGLKIDFFDSESQEIVQFYQDALRDAAAYHLMIDFHGANKPTGESRSYPNEMTREAIRGMENRPPWAQSNTVLPFTRYLAGHADFTPVHFGDRMGEVTPSHHVASAVVFTSPFLCYGADPQSILDNPAREFIQRIPPTWDETIVLPQSAIGELALFARRKGSIWYLAALNGRNEPKTVSVDLSFLKGSSFELSYCKDEGSQQGAVKAGTEKVRAGSTLIIQLNASGGYAGRFEKSATL